MARERRVLPLPRGRSALEAELARIDRALAGIGSRRARRLLAIERRRVVLALDARGRR